MTRAIRFLLLGLMVAGSVSAVSYPKQPKIGKTVIATALARGRAAAHRTRDSK